jgi:Tetratricopeptide repeat
LQGFPASDRSAATIRTARRGVKGTWPLVFRCAAGIGCAAHASISWIQIRLVSRLLLATTLCAMLGAGSASAAVPLLASRARWGLKGVLTWQAVNDHVLGRAGESNPCGFEMGRAVVDAAWEGDVLVGRLTLCTSCGERTVPYLGVHVSANGTVVADVSPSLVPGCESPGLDRRGRLILEPLAEPAGRPPLSHHLEAGEKLLQLRRGKAAQAEFQKALAAKEDPGKAWLGIGLSAVLLGDAQAAVAAYQKARSFAPSVLLSYNLACAQARLGRVDEALASLSDSIERGFAASGDLLRDPDLAPLRGDPRFSALLARTKNNEERRR